MQCILELPDSPPPRGHYAHAVIHNGIVYVSGQLPIEPASGRIPQGIEEQTHLVIRKLEDILVGCGSSLSQTLQVRIYIADVAFWPEVNAVYAKRFGDHRPARCIVPVSPLHYGCLIELEAVAAT